LTGLISIPLNSTGKTWKMDINGHIVQENAHHEKVLKSHEKPLPLFCMHPLGVANCPCQHTLAAVPVYIRFKHH